MIPAQVGAVRRRAEDLNSGHARGGEERAVSPVPEVKSARRGAIVPRYAVVPLLMSLVINMMVYYGCRPLTAAWRHHDVSTPVDGLIPFFPPASVIYLLTFVFWVVGFVVIARESRADCCRNLAGEQIAKLLCIACFLLFPTQMERPEITGDGVFAWLMRLIYRLDEPNMLFPSIHCLDSWFCFRGAMRCPHTARGWRVFCFVFSLLVFASTLLVKQHLFVDVIGGVAVLELGLWLSDRLRAARVYEHLPWEPGV